MPLMKLTVKGMHCASCKMLIEEALDDLGAKNINIDLDEASQTGTVTLETDLPKEKIIEAIKEEGDYTIA